MSIWRREGESYQPGDFAPLNELATRDRFVVYEPKNHWPECVMVGEDSLRIIEEGRAS